MCYKQELQKVNKEKLEAKFQKYNVPKFIRDYFKFLNSENGKLVYWCLIKDLLSWLIDNKIINKSCIAEITPNDLNSVSTVDIIDYLDSLSSNSNDTLNNKKNKLSSFWNYLVDQEFVRKNIISSLGNKFKADKRSKARKKLKMPDEDDLKILMSNIENIIDDFDRLRNLTIVRCLKGTGIRESELVGLDVDNVNLIGSTDKTKSIRPYIEVVGKGSYKEAEAECVDLSNDALLALTDWWKIRNKMNTSSKALFVGRDGNRLTERKIIYIFNKYSEGTITPHMMRHYYATVLYKETKHDHSYVREQLRHSSANTTLTIYTESDNSMIDTALSNL